MATIAVILIEILVLLAFYLIIKKLNFLINQNKTIIMKQSEVAAELVALKSQLAKVATEVLGKLAELETAVNNQGDASPEVVSALGDLKTAASGLDALIPDAPTEPTV